jgi:hypothetical protein
MKILNVNLSVIFYFLFSYNSFSQVYLNAVAPLNPGNLWKYYDIGWLGGQSNYFVTDSVRVIGSDIYSVVHEYQDTNPTKYQNYYRLRDDGFYIRYDEYNSDSTYKYYKKDCKLSDTWTEEVAIFILNFTVIDTLTINAWGKNYFARVIKITDNSLIEVYQVWADTMGLIEEINPEGSHVILRGCVINGVVYGDTTTVDVKDDFELPQSHMLLQNYPNPFNPITKISFYIPFGTDVSLKVYNLFGEEVKTLVNEYRSAGSYTELFDGKGLSSGVYIYVINAGKFTEMKKMILLK